MKISVVTPSYNQAQFLEQTILSVLNQDYHNVEYIIIDGGSSDGSVDIIRKYEKFLTYWVSEKDSGQSEAINKGFKKATGEIVGWINSDDYYAPNYFSKVVNIFQSNNKIGLVYGNNNIVNEKDEIIGVYKRKVTLRRLLNGQPDVVQPGSFYRKTFLDKVGLLDEKLKYAMDFDLWLRLLKISDIFKVDEIVANFRIHSGSKTYLYGKNFLTEILEIKKKYGIKKYSWHNKHLLYRLMKEKIFRWFR